LFTPSAFWFPEMLLCISMKYLEGWNHRSTRMGRVDGYVLIPVPQCRFVHLDLGYHLGGRQRPATISGWLLLLPTDIATNSDCFEV
jgi:hypothetical protein